MKLLILLALFATVSSRTLQRSRSEATVDEIISNGAKTANTAANVIASPVTLTATKVNSLANALPNAFAAGGAALGSAIAFPIQLMSSAASGAASGVTGLIVGIPVAIGSSLHASRGKDLFIRVKPPTEQASKDVTTPVYESTTLRTDYDDEEEYDDTAAGNSAATRFILRPIAVLVGAKSAISGAGSYAIGRGLEKIGGTFTSIGNSLAFTGNEVRGTGATLFNWGSGHELPLLSSDDDLIAAVNVTKQLPEPMKDLVLDTFYK